jgi:hypothetical protein
MSSLSASAVGESVPENNGLIRTHNHNADHPFKLLPRSGDSIAFSRLLFAAVFMDSRKNLYSFGAELDFILFPLIMSSPIHQAYDKNGNGLTFEVLSLEESAHTWGERGFILNSISII